MPRAVRFHTYGDVDVLRVDEVPRPEPADNQVLVQVVAAGINPGETAIRTGVLHERWPATFPSGEGSDFAGRVVTAGSSVTGFRLDDEVIGWSDWRSSHADFVVVNGDHLAPKPLALDWIRAGGLFIVGVTAYAAVRAVAPKPGETVAVSAAAGGVGSLTVQLAREAGARVVGIAGERNAGWLRSVGITPVTYGDGLADRVRAVAPDGVDAFIDTYGQGYVDLAAELGVAPERIDTIADPTAPQRHPGVKIDGNMAGASPETLAELAALIAEGRLELPIARVYPLAEVREAYTELERRHTLGKIVLRP